MYARTASEIPVDVLSVKAGKLQGSCIAAEWLLVSWSCGVRSVVLVREALRDVAAEASLIMFLRFIPGVSNSLRDSAGN